jgi:hypothetical protein
MRNRRRRVSQPQPGRGHSEVALEVPGIGGELAFELRDRRMMIA